MQPLDNNNKKTGEKYLTGYSVYPPNDDIYNRAKGELDLDPESPGQLKIPLEPAGNLNEKNFIEDVSGGDLDIPSSEMDDKQENIGSEDEEYNF